MYTFLLIVARKGSAIKAESTDRKHGRGKLKATRSYRITMHRTVSTYFSCIMDKSNFLSLPLNSYKKKYQD